MFRLGILIVTIASVNAFAKSPSNIEMLSLRFGAPVVSDEADVPAPDKGDIIYDNTAGQFKGNTNGTTGGWVAFNGGTAILVGARYAAPTAGTQSIANGSTAIIDFSVSTFDTDSAVTTGASWNFTAPSTGYYSVKAAIQYAQGTFNSGGQHLYLYKNGSLYSLMGRLPVQFSGTYTPSVNGSDLIYLSAGDYIDLRTSHGDSTARSLSATTGANYVAIEKVGN